MWKKTLICVGLLGIVALALGAGAMMNSRPTPMLVATTDDAGAGNLTAGGDAVTFYWSAPTDASNSDLAKVQVVAHPDYTGRLYITWNASTAGTDDWNCIAEAGDKCVNPDGKLIETVTIYAETTNATYETNFVVQGWR